MAAVKKAMQSANGKTKLYEVIKALTAMRLTKEDSVPSNILSRMKKADGGLDPDHIIPSPHPAGSDDALPEKYEVPEGITHENSEPCYYQGSIGTAYNKEAL